MTKHKVLAPLQSLNTLPPRINPQVYPSLMWVPRCLLYHFKGKAQPVGSTAAPRYLPPGNKATGVPTSLLYGCLVPPDVSNLHPLRATTTVLLQPLNVEKTSVICVTTFFFNQKSVHQSTLLWFLIFLISNWLSDCYRKSINQEALEWCNTATSQIALIILVNKKEI